MIDHNGASQLVARAAAQKRREGNTNQAVVLARMWLANEPCAPEVRLQLALAMLSVGQFADAWPLFEDRLVVIPPPRLPYPLWRGQSVIGREVLVLGEQTIEAQEAFAPCLDELSARGAKVTFLCDPSLVKRFAEKPFATKAMAGEVEFPDPDLWTMQGSIPGVLGLSPPAVMEWAKAA